MDQDHSGKLAAFDWKFARLTHRGFMPHVRQDNAVYFVTFRLADSLPVHIQNSLNERREAWLKRNPLPHTSEQVSEYRKIWTAPVENWLDSGLGSCVLKEGKYRSLLEGILRHHDGVQYRLGEFVIMPNHVHVLVSMVEKFELTDTLRVWKSYSSRVINGVIGRKGSLWMREYFDHVVRDEEHLKKFIGYIQQNPRKQRPGEYTLGKGSLKV